MIKTVKEGLRIYERELEAFRDYTTMRLNPSSNDIYSGLVYRHAHTIQGMEQVLNLTEKETEKIRKKILKVKTFPPFL